MALIHMEKPVEFNRIALEFLRGKRRAYHAVA